jgi:hypothetical protein
MEHLWSTTTCIGTVLKNGFDSFAFYRGRHYKTTNLEYYNIEIISFKSYKKDPLEE